MAFAGMPKRRAQPMSEINMTPLIDVMLVLLVIFMLAAPLMVGALQVQLPKRVGSAAVAQGAQLSLVVTAQGQVLADHRPVEGAALDALLQRTAALDPATEIRLSADVRVPYGRVVEVMAQAHRAGLTRIGFVTEAATAPAKTPEAAAAR